MRGCVHERVCMWVDEKEHCVGAAACDNNGEVITFVMWCYG